MLDGEVFHDQRHQGELHGAGGYLVAAEHLRLLAVGEAQVQVAAAAGADVHVHAGEDHRQCQPHVGPDVEVHLEVQVVVALAAFGIRLGLLWLVVDEGDVAL